MVGQIEYALMHTFPDAMVTSIRQTVEQLTCQNYMVPSQATASRGGTYFPDNARLQQIWRRVFPYSQRILPAAALSGKDPPDQAFFRARSTRVSASCASAASLGSPRICIMAVGFTSSTEILPGDTSRITALQGSKLATSLFAV